MKKPVKKETSIELSDKLFISRKQLREFCAQNNIPHPKYFASDQFANISAWAVNHNAFPMALKTIRNLTDGKLNFLLKGFRELPEFYAQIEEQRKGLAIIEEFINSKARLEICCVKGKIKLISQVSLDKSVYLRHSWRAFPIKLPAAIMKGVNEIISHFKPLLESYDKPVRFGFALSKTGPVLVALNTEGERPEYSEEWCKLAGIGDIVSSDKTVGGDIVCKVVYARNFDKESFSEDLLRHLCGECYKAHKISGDDVVVLLASKDTEVLQKASKFTI